MMRRERTKVSFFQNRIRYVYEPKEDISPYELARILPIFGHVAAIGMAHDLLSGGPLPEVLREHISSLPDEVLRHFRRAE